VWYLHEKSLFYYYHYHHRYTYSYHNFIITILCYAPSVITCTVGGAIQMTVYIYIYINSKAQPRRCCCCCWWWWWWCTSLGPTLLSVPVFVLVVVGCCLARTGCWELSITGRTLGGLQQSRHVSPCDVSSDVTVPLWRRRHGNLSVRTLSNVNTQTAASSIITIITASDSISTMSLYNASYV